MEAIQLCWPLYMDRGSSILAAWHSLYRDYIAVHHLDNVYHIPRPNWSAQSNLTSRCRVAFIIWHPRATCYVTIDWGKGSGSLLARHPGSPGDMSWNFNPAFISTSVHDIFWIDFIYSWFMGYSVFINYTRQFSYFNTHLLCFFFVCKYKLHMIKPSLYKHAYGINVFDSCYPIFICFCWAGFLYETLITIYGREQPT